VRREILARVPAQVDPSALIGLIVNIGKSVKVSPVIIAFVSPIERLADVQLSQRLFDF